MLLAIGLPIITSILVSVITGDISNNKEDCPPHSWSHIAMTEKIVCVICSKESYINPFI